MSRNRIIKSTLVCTVAQHCHLLDVRWRVYRYLYSNLVAFICESWWVVGMSQNYVIARKAKNGSTKAKNGSTNADSTHKVKDIYFQISKIYLQIHIYLYKFVYLFVCHIFIFVFCIWIFINVCICIQIILYAFKSLHMYTNHIVRIQIFLRQNYPHKPNAVFKTF